MVTKPTSNDGVVHDWLVRLVLEVAVPARSELWTWPLVHDGELFLCRSDLDTGFDTVGGEWTCAVDVPLVEDFLLNLGVTTSKVVEGLHMGFGSVGCECEIVVLEIETDSGKIDERLDTGLAKLLWVSDTRSLQDKRRTKSTSGDNDLLPSFDDPGCQLSGRKGLGGNDLDADGTVALKDYLLNLIVDHQMQILVHGTSAVDVAMSRVRTASSVAVDPLEPMLGSMASDQILEIVGGRDALGFGSSQEILLDGVSVVAKGDLDWAFKSVDVTVVARTLVRLVLLHEGDQLFGGPTFGLEVIVVRSRGTSVHLHHG